MPSVVHVVTTDNFAGVERYVCDVASRDADARMGYGGRRGQRRTHAGDARSRLPLASGRHARAGARSLRRVGRRDLCHAHMTAAEAISIAARPFHRASIVSTRHFAAPRGASRGGRLLAPWIGRQVAREIAISEFVAADLSAAQTS